MTLYKLPRRTEAYATYIKKGFPKRGRYLVNHNDAAKAVHAFYQSCYEACDAESTERYKAAMSKSQPINREEFFPSWLLEWSILVKNFDIWLAQELTYIEKKKDSSIYDLLEAD